jgi:glutaredoxin 3
MNDIVIYTKDYCPYCTRAKDLLKRKGRSDFREIDITTDAGAQQEMLGKANGRKTVPQIFIGTTHVGGYDDLAALDREGRLDGLLA